ncbi:LbetaH domain-containing protein [Acinetobacter shaoyimingii]|uniref:Chloramphenicol acetyltransferase n=1 Tax=Acinetobacter shaoyimingii TaxID=2715164 RepID=A0A6G8RS69_9GAMM|nr:antibiotic acetyltransferase [Acinetobacter shaoyimingii]QIO04563.1 antibiotic acetyltransferase [Acinetobacter shaoyimingii]
MDIFLKFSQENKVFFSEKNFNGEGFIEEFGVVRGKLDGRFYLGAYSLIEHGVICKNTFVGRFSIIERNCYIGRKIDRSAFSNHNFVYGESITSNFTDSYYSKIKSKRFYYEKDQICFIGNDVRVGQNSVINEGVEIGDGALIYPNSYVLDNIPPYAIVSGSPAKVIGYRFDEDLIAKHLASKWWKYDISQFFDDRTDLVNDFKFIKDLDFKKITKLNLKKYYLNTHKSIYKINVYETAVIGPSHIQIWQKKWFDGKIADPSFYLLPIPAMALTSDQSKRMIEWWLENFKKIILFVPDFRIGNTTIDNERKDSRFINHKFVGHDNDLKCYSEGVKRLNFYSQKKGIYFLFWCLYGRESLNRVRGKFINNNGSYNHPIWNYYYLINKFKDNSIDVSTYFEDIESHIVDDSIHPNDKCYAILDRIMISYLDTINQ